jgi:hypothetical protein
MSVMFVEKYVALTKKVGMHFYHTLIKILVITHISVSGSSICIATDYGLDGPGVESRWGRDFPHLCRPVLGTIQPPLQRVPGFSRR